ncbi:MAG: penicillin-binding protein [Prevotella sp.]|nr:penicillin-binding protein [Prevotella sp.]
MKKNPFTWCGQKLKACWQWYKSLYVGRAWYVKLLSLIASLLVAFLLYLGMVDINFLGLFGRSPGFISGLEPQISQASEIYSSDGVMIGKYFSENRTPVKYEDVNPDFWRVLIDTEDERFYRHIGIDPIGMFAAAKDAVLHHDARGASTITQQLAKNMFKMRTKYSGGPLSRIPGVGMLITKTKEWLVALKLEYLYSKEEILTMYANTVDFGSNAFGIKTACKTYFNTTPKNLKLEQAAVLVGMLKATTTYNPITHPDNSLKRRNLVLRNMVERGDLTKAGYDTLCLKPIQLDYSVEKNYDGQALYFREAIAKHLEKWCEDNGYDLYNSGLKIYTTLDTRMQKYAEAAAKKQMQQVQRNFNSHWAGHQPWVDERGNVIPNFIEDIADRLPVSKYLKAKFPNEPDSVAYYLNLPHTVKLFDYEQGSIEKEMSTLDSIRYMVSFMHCSMVAMEAETGAVKAWVGDIDFDSWKYDKVTAMRQPGSTFKLFVYTEAMNQGLTPCDKRRDEYFSMQVWDEKKKKEVTWAPTNANGYFTGDSMTLKRAFAQSINSVAVRLGQEMGIKRIAETAHRMGIQSPLDETPALALGSSDVNLLELANAYCTVADDGKYHQPRLVERIVDNKGREVYVSPVSNVQAIPYKSAYLVQELLKSGLTERGATSMSLWGYVGKFRDTEFGGKTGTSNNHSDAWFMAVSPKLVVGAWVGGEYRSIHFRTGALGQGSRTALPICGYFLEAVLDDPAFKQYRVRFNKPKDDDITSDMYNCQDTYYYQADTLLADTLEFEEDIMLDDEGNPISQPAESNDGYDDPANINDDPFENL